MEVLIPNREWEVEEIIKNNDNTEHTRISHYNHYLQMPDAIDRVSNCMPPSIMPFDEFKNGNSYTQGDIVYVQLTNGRDYSIQYYKFYKAISDVPSDSGGNTPIPPLSPTYWQEITPDSSTLINAFDTYINTKYEGVCINFMEFNLDATKPIDAIALLGLKNRQVTFTWKNSQTQKVETIDTYEHISSNFYEYFFGEWYKKGFAVSKKQLINAESVSFETSGDILEVGTILVGRLFDVGATLYGYEKRNRDFSTISTTQTGLEYITKGKNSKKIILKVLVKNGREQKVFDFLQSLSATLVLYLLEDGNWVFGYYKDFYMTKQNPVFSEYHLEINGVI